MGELLQLLYKPEHINCVNYASDKSPVVELLWAERDETVALNTTCTFILCMRQGSADISWDETENYPLKAGQFMLFPPGTQMVARVKDSSSGVALRLSDSVKVCDKYSLKNLYRDMDMSKLTHTHLEANSMVRSYIESLAENVESGLRCVRFLEMKVNEIFYYLRAYYSKEELARFNMPMLSENACFLNFVWKNYRRVRNMKELAAFANCAPSTFKVNFKRITGVSPSEWLLERKIRNIRHDICQGLKSLDEISEEYHFSSASNLGTFCRKHFGVPPGQMRLSKDMAEK